MKRSIKTTSTTLSPNHHPHYNHPTTTIFTLKLSSFFFPQNTEMSSMASKRLESVQENKSRRAIEEQMRVWEEEVEALCTNKYRLLNYLASLLSSSPPDPVVGNLLLCIICIFPYSSVCFVIIFHISAFIYSSL